MILILVQIRTQCDTIELLLNTATYTRDSKYDTSIAITHSPDGDIIVVWIHSVDDKVYIYIYLYFLHKYSTSTLLFLWEKKAMMS